MKQKTLICNMKIHWNSILHNQFNFIFSKSYFILKLSFLEKHRWNKRLFWYNSWNIDLSMDYHIKFKKKHKIKRKLIWGLRIIFFSNFAWSQFFLAHVLYSGFRKKRICYNLKTKLAKIDFNSLKQTIFTFFRNIVIFMNNFGVKNNNKNTLGKQKHIWLAE